MNDAIAGRWRIVSAPRTCNDLGGRNGSRGLRFTSSAAWRYQDAKHANHRRDQREGCEQSSPAVRCDGRRGAPLQAGTQ